MQADELERQLDQLTAEGKFLKMSEAEARAKWPEATPAALGALEKVKDDGSVAVRILYDGSHGVDVNMRIRQRDQDSGPCAADIKRVLREQSAVGQSLPRTITVDIEDAHRVVNVREQDWRFQLCRARDDGPVYASKVGMFGVSSISYLWGRLAGAALRALHYASGIEEELWALLVADDYKVDSTAPGADRSLLFFLAFFHLLGLPIKWAKTDGGDQVDWVGYSVLVRRFRLGLSANRAAWIVRWCRQHADQGSGIVGELRDGLGRLAFAAGALTYERPFLAPLYAYVARQPAGALRRYLVFVRLLLHFIADRVERRRHYDCGLTRLADTRRLRVDARADGSSIGLGGWLPTPNQEGRLDRWSSPWFALDLDIHTAPWAYSRGGKPNRTIASLEALATLYAVRLFAPFLRANTRGTVELCGFTDNQGNSHALTKLVTSKFPLCCVVMELSVALEALDLQLALAWAPRELNTEADALSNGLTDGFDPAKRLAAEVINWNLLDDWMTIGQRFFEENSAAGAPPGRARKRRREDRLRHRDPWGT